MYKHQDDGDTEPVSFSVKIVCSRSLDSVAWNNSTLIKENVSNEITKLKVTGNKDIYVFGSANLSETLMADNVFDEYRICIAPIIAGKGRCLFPNGLPAINLRLISLKQLSTGGAILEYEPV